ncbi:MAG TPA: tyrosine-type recombinase/integrase [Acidocella sp.]|uniref:tyrosine-type recombinase/integrase n=1 Tax=Acidocella sp. TaxID=50710 RepID=UPI002C812691|nr:tyrosine-type recombinase/integrase [Acidocella sp.]HVE22192.1 tyrosine-type recombinase/integrase [Acidocella sp.]
MLERLTDAIAKELAAPSKGNRVYYDPDLPGFGCRVTSAGARSWVLNYRSRGIERRMTIGSLENWKARDARKRAEELKRAVDAGGDPMADLHAERSAPTVNDLAKRFTAEHLPKKRPGTQDEYSRLLKAYILPAMGSKKVADIRHADVEDMHRRIRKDAPYSANRAVAVVSKMFSLSIKWEMRENNPAIGIEKAPEHKRKRYLTPAEIARLSEALNQADERMSANVVRLLLLTGARKGETLAAKWSDFDLEAGTWTKPGATTKTATDHHIPLSAPALALLGEMKQAADQDNDRRKREKLPPIDFVFPSQDAAGNITSLKDIKNSWATLCRKADLKGVRIHDLRHTFASVLASSGLSLPIIGALLGHTQAATTQRYAHLLDDPLRKATETAGAIIGAKPTAEVVDMKGRRA